MRALTLNADIARALGVPPEATRAVLTLEAGKLPRIEVTLLVLDRHGRAKLDALPLVSGGEREVAPRLARIRYMLRLEPFPEDDPA